MKIKKDTIIGCTVTIILFIINLSINNVNGMSINFNTILFGIIIFVSSTIIYNKINNKSFIKLIDKLKIPGEIGECKKCYDHNFNILSKRNSTVDNSLILDLISIHKNYNHQFITDQIANPNLNKKEADEIKSDYEKYKCEIRSYKNKVN